MLWCLPGHRNDFAGSGWGQAVVSHQTWADYQLSRKEGCPHFCFPRGSLFIWDLLYSQHAVLSDHPPPPPQWRIDMNFAVSFNNSPLSEWLIYHLVRVHGGISSSEHGVRVFWRSRFQILPRRRALLTDVFLGFPQANSEITSWIRALWRHPKFTTLPFEGV
jgi:hypothetical protein